jgi:hypothetical protein
MHACSDEEAVILSAKRITARRAIKSEQALTTTRLTVRVTKRSVEIGASNKIEKLPYPLPVSASGYRGCEPHDLF